MAFLTIFSAPKPFTNPQIATIQRNAIQSWWHLPDVEMLLIGNETGVAEVAAEFGVKHLPDVACNAYGTPLISSMFDLARRNSREPLLCIVNADILLMSDFVAAAHCVSRLTERFVIVGQRWDLDVRQPLDFSGDWESRLRDLVQERGALHRPAGSDYFIFPRGCFASVPDFTIGRAGWDNWMIYHARCQKWSVVDATASVMVIHQSHDYSHLPGGQPHYNLPETNVNIRLAGGAAITKFTLLDADRRLDGRKLLSPRRTLRKIIRDIETLPLLHWNNYALTQRLSLISRRLRKKLRRL